MAMYQTLDDFRGSFLFQVNSLKHLNMKDISAYLHENRDVMKIRRPEDYALDFYLLNHAVFELGRRFSMNEKLDDEHIDFMNLYVERNLEIFTSAFLYLLVITTKESRHILTNKHDCNMHEDNFIDDYVRGKYDDCYRFTRMLKDKKESQDYKANRALLNKDQVPNVSLQTYLEYLETLYSHGEWYDEYGGEVWATITNVLLRFVKGEISPENLVDNMWTLSHNNGLIFNKHIVFSNYESEEGMLEILNAQAIGRLPEYADQTSAYSSKGKKIFNRVKKVLPEIFDLKTSYEDLMEEIAEYGYNH
jgi:hypothetical protein